MAELPTPVVISAFSMHNELSSQTEDRSGRSWDTTVRCACGEFESKSRAEQWFHASSALRGELAAALGSMSEKAEELEAMTVYAECLARGLSDSEARGTAWPEDDPGVEYGVGGCINPAPDARPVSNNIEPAYVAAIVNLNSEIAALAKEWDALLIQVHDLGVKIAEIEETSYY